MRDRSRRRGQTKDRSRESSRDRAIERSRDRSQDRSRDRRNDSSEGGRRVQPRDRRRSYSRNYSSDREVRSRSCNRERNYSQSYSRDRTRRCERSADESSSEDLRTMVKQLKRELKSVQSRSMNDEHAVPKFDPSRDNADIEQWVRQVDRLARRYMWSDDNVIINISRNLKGYARRIFDEK